MTRTMGRIHDLTPTIRFLTVVVLLALGGSTSAVTLDVPGQYGTLEAALAVARNGDVIEIYPGVHAARDLKVTVGVTIRGVGPDAGAVVLDGGHQFRILTVEYVDTPVWIQNLTFRDGFALGESVNLMSGGALFVSYSNVALQNCRFENNRAGGHGGAIRSIESRLRVSQCDFLGNTAQQGGGAVDASYDADPIFLRCLFQDNFAAWGGAVSCRGGAAPTFKGCDFVDNTAGGILGYGGAIFADYDGAPSFEACTFHGNAARLGGAVAAFQGSDVTVARSTVVGNSSSETGGGFFCLDGSPRIESSIIAFQTGSGITSEAAARPVVACTGVWNNSAGDVIGPVGSADLIEVDPGFCIDPGGGSSRFLLAEGSPLAPGAVPCAEVGAWPVGCESALPVVSSFDAQLAGDFLTVSWRAEGDPDHDRYRLTWNDGGLEHEILLTHQGDGYYTGYTAIPPETRVGFTLQLYARGDDSIWQPLLDGDVGNDLPGDELPPATPTIMAVRNWPNPFNPSTTIAYDLPHAQHVKVGVYAANGRRVVVLQDTWMPEGTHEITWNGRDTRGRQVASGTYVVRVDGKQSSTSHKISLLK